MTLGPADSHRHSWAQYGQTLPSIPSPEVDASETRTLDPVQRSAHPAGRRCLAAIPGTAASVPPALRIADTGLLMNRADAVHGAGETTQADVVVREVTRGRCCCRTAMGVPFFVVHLPGSRGQPRWVVP